MRKNDIEKSLKRFLKRKISYSLSLLIAFMITGGISFGAGITTEEIQETKNDILTRIETEREEIKRKIEENEELIKELNTGNVELVRKGDFYSKPTNNSTQVFFSYQHLDSGKGKDVTEKEFSKTLAANSNISKGDLIASNGVIVNDEKHVISIDVGVNIKPVQIKLPSIKPEVGVKIPNIPVNLGETPKVSEIKPPKLEIDTPDVSIGPPNLGSINTPSVASVGTVGAVAKPNISLIPDIEEKELTIGKPPMPEGFNPHQLIEPKLVQIKPIEVVDITTPGGSKMISQPEWQTSNSKAYFWNTLKSWNTSANKTYANNALISQPIMKSGKLDIVMNDYVAVDFGAYAGYKATITDYTASFADGEVDDGNNLSYTGKNNIERVQLTQTVVENAGSEIIRVGGTTYSSLGKDTTIKIDSTSRDKYMTWDLNNKQRTIINFLPYGETAEIDEITEATLSERELAKELFEKYKQVTITSTKSQILALSGTIEVKGAGINIVTLQSGRTSDNKNTSSIILNSGTIKVNGNLNSVFALPQTSNPGVVGTDPKPEIISNTGTIEINGNSNTLMLISRSSSRIPTVSSFHNNGIINISGEDNIGYRAGAEITNGYVDLEKPITILKGERNTGVILETPQVQTINSKSKIKVDIKEGRRNTGFYLSTSENIPVNTPSTQEIAETKININGGENNLGIWLSARSKDKKYKLNEVEINITNGNKNFGVLTREYTEDGNRPTLSGSIELTSSNEKGINISGGSGNIGVGVASYGKVTYNGTISITGGDNGYGVYTRQGKDTTISKIEITGGTGNVAAYSEKNPKSGNANDPNINQQKLTVNEIKIEESGALDSFAVIGDKNAEMNIGKLDVIIKNSGSGNAGAIYANDRATINVTDEAEIDVTGKVNSEQDIRGFGLTANNGGIITIVGKNKHIKVVDGAVAIASFGNNSNIDAKSTTIEYKGNGYAVYSDGKGSVDISNANIILDGKAVAFKIDESIPLNTITATGTTYNVKSNDVIVFNLLNLNNSLSTDSLKNDILDLVSSSSITADAGITKYKLAAVNGGTINIGTLNKAKGEYYYDNFLGQRLKLKADDSTITAILTNDQAREYRDQVVGLEISSSSLATSNGETTIELKNSTIIADRDGIGAGAVGAFINYGQVTIDGTSSIKVEKDTTNAANAGAVGVYSVNGSEVTNDGTIEVGGANSIGILGMAYREDANGTSVGAEFGTGASGQGRIDITNAAKISLDGNGSIGIYADNNNGSATSTQTKVTNEISGEIKVGNSTNTETAIGIYGKKAEISNKGRIAVGTEGVAIYALDNSKVTSIGNLTLNSGGIGVMLDDTSKITATSITLNKATATSTGQIGVYYNGDSSSTSSGIISLAIDISDLEEGTAIYAKNKDITSSGTLTIGKKGIGIVADGKKGTNEGIIILHSTKGSNAIGMYTKNSEIVNNSLKNINLDGNSQIGMFAEGSASKLTNSGNINLKGTESIGIYLKDGARTKINTSNNIVFSGSKNIGIYADNSVDLTFENSLNFTNNNVNENIYMYAKNTVIDIATGAILTVDGVGIPASTNENKKTIGIYITNSTIKGEISVKGGAIGIYSNGINTLDNITLTANGEGTTGVFIDGTSTITGTVTARGAAGVGAVGVYGSGGAVTIGAGGLTLNTDTDKGTGMYLADGAYASGGKITVNNTATVDNIGVYYSKGTASGTVTNGAEVELTGNKSIGIYAADGINLVNTKNITSTGLSNNIASYVGGNSTLTSNGNITMTGTGGNIGIYTGKGSGINNGAIDLTGSTGTSSAGMVAKTDTSSDTASVENKNTITVGSNLGMYVAGNGTSSGKNTGTITATTGTGVYLEGVNASFDGTGGTIITNRVGIYLKDTVTDAVANTGTLNIASDGIGVYGDKSAIDFTVDTSTSTGETSVVAKGGGSVSGDIKAGRGAIGLYLVDNSTTVSGITITTGEKTSTLTSTGVYLKAAGTYTLSNVTIDAKDGVGIYLDNSTVLGSGAKTLNYNGTITTTNGQGIFVNSGNILTTGTTTFNVNENKGVGVYIASGATANIGSTTTTTFNLNGGIAIYNNGGTLNLGANVAITGSGSLVATVNGDITSEANFTVGTGAMGLLGEYDGTINASMSKSITNKGAITVQAGGMGIAAIKNEAKPPIGNIKITNDTNGKLYVSGKDGDSSPIGIYTNIAEVGNNGLIEVGTDGIGIYVANSGKSITSTTINMTGANGVAVYTKGSVGNVTLDGITSTSSKNTGVMLDEITSGSTISLGTISLGNESVGVMVGDGKGQITPTITTITVGNSSADKSAIGVIAKNSNINFANIGNLIAGVKGIGVYAYAGANISNLDLDKITVGTGGKALYSVDSTLTNVSGSIAADNKIGIYVEGGSITGNITGTTVSNGGTGIYLNKTNISGLTIGNITIQAGRDKENQSIGAYYKDMSLSVNLSGITQTGAYTVGSVLENTSGITGVLDLTNASNSVGIIIKSSANHSLGTGNITVSGAKNIGVHSTGADITVGTLNVSASNASDDKSLSSIGVYAKNGKIITNGISIGDNSIGIYSEEAREDVLVTGNIFVGNNGLGIYASKKTGNAKIDVNSLTNTVGNNSAIGIFGNNIDINVSGGFTIGTNTSIGIVSEGNGDVVSNGGMTIGNSSIGIYKIGGAGTIATATGTDLTLSNKAYGIYLTGTSSTVNNNADMTLGEAAIGIYSNGTNTINNSGVITVGKTSFGPDNNPGTTADNMNSVGIFMSGGTTVYNTGTININEALSVGVYSSEAGNIFVNQATGTINVDNGGIGVIVKGGAIAENNGTINLGGTINTAGESIGMAAYTGATIVNNTTGVINVTEGVGMYVATGAMLENKGTINILNGTGIFGDGQIVNSGNIEILFNGTGEKISDGTVISTESIKIDKNGNVTINDKLHALGGTITVDGTLDLNGVFVDITGKPVFEADSITGEVNILPNFALTGNGYTYEIEGFLSAVNGALSAGKVSPNLSPLWVADIDRDGNLIIVKRPYAEITIGNQFDSLDKGLDNILMGNGNEDDKDILKDLNHYLSGLSEEDYKKEAGKMLGETRGDIYSTIQGRMQDINRAFDNSFYELESSYNLTKDSSKYSAIYTDGNYKDSTLGIDDYDYKIMGVLYMKEKEGTEYGSKYGYTLGFTGSKFDFDDGGSKEDVYSLRVGAHRVKSLSDANKVSWLSRIELGYNRHIAKRKLNLQETFENKGEYNTYSVALDNRLTKVIYTDLSRQLDVYADLDLEYGKIDDFKESAGSKGGLEVQIKDNDYLSAQAGAGVKASQRIYAGNDISVKVTADVKYAYELGDNYDGNKARLKNGGEGYYSLITPEESEGKLTGKIGLTIEKANHMGVTFEVEAADEGNRKDSSIKYGMRFNYKF